LYEDPHALVMAAKAVFTGYAGFFDGLEDQRALRAPSEVAA
jgi:hypothetical protein